MKFVIHFLDFYLSVENFSISNISDSVTDNLLIEIWSLLNKAFSSARVLFMMLFQVLKDLLLFLDLSRVVFCLFICDLDLKLVVFELFLLSLDFNAKIKKLFFQPRLVLAQSRLFRLVIWDKTLLDLNRGRKYFIDQFLTLFGKHFQLNLLFFLGFDLFEEFVIWLIWRDHLVIFKVLNFVLLH